MSRQQPKLPSYGLHKASGQAVVYLNRRARYLGKHGSAESYQEYERVVAEWRECHCLPIAASWGATSSDVAGLTKCPLTVNELLVRYFAFAKCYYVDGAGATTHEFDSMRYAAKPLRALYGHTLAKDFGPLALKAVRGHLVDGQRLCRQVINSRVNRMRRIFKWGVSEELIAPEIFHALQAVAPLRFGRTTAAEAPPIKPAPPDAVSAVLACVSPQIAAMVQLQQVAGMRPQDVVRVRAADIDMTEDVWVYSPHQHKNAWRGDVRRIYLGPQAQRLLEPFLNRPPEQFLFGPAEAEQHRAQQRRISRRTPMTPSQAKRTPKRKPKRAKRDAYDVASYRRAVGYGVAKANRARARDGLPPIEAWCPLQLRHSRGTEIRRLYGLEGAQLNSWTETRARY